MTLRESILHQARTTCQLPVMAVRIFELLRDPESDLRTIEALIRHEPVLSAVILRHANAVACGSRQPVTGIGPALIRLGYRQTSELILQLALAPLAEPPLTGYGLRHGDLWCHAAATAIATDALAAECGLQAPIDAFTAALLHDLGKVVLHPFVGEQASRIHNQAFSGSCSFEDAEQQILGVNHAEVGAELITAWGLGPDLAECVRWHHDPHRASGRVRDLTELIHAAQHIVTLAGIGGGRDGLQYYCSESALKRFSMTPPLIEKILCRTVSEMEHLMQLTHIKPGSSAA